MESQDRWKKPPHEQGSSFQDALADADALFRLIEGTPILIDPSEGPVVVFQTARAELAGRDVPADEWSQE